MSDPAAATLTSSANWQPDAQLNRASPQERAFSENASPDTSSFLETRDPDQHSFDAFTLRQGAAASPGATHEAGPSAAYLDGDASAQGARNTGIHHDPSRTLDHDALPATSVPDEAKLRQEYDAGFAAGIDAGRTEARRQIDVEKQGVREFLDALNKSLANTQDFFLPLENLAIHIAEQLVRGELKLSGDAIRRLVENSLLEVEHRGERVSVRLNPEDLEKFSLQDGELSDTMELVRDPTLTRGSVKIEMAGGTIEDFIENRLDALARSVLGPSVEGYVKRPATALRTKPQDDGARFQARPLAGSVSVEPPAQGGHNVYIDASETDEDDAELAA